jgi:gamma-glutamylputrescine oxidase
MPEAVRGVTDNPGHTASWYAASANDKRVRPALDGDRVADVCVIGAGFSGISAALELAERGYSVIVLEAERIGFGASGRNGGQIVNGYSRDLQTIAARYGAQKAVKLGEMSLEGAAIIRERVQNTPSTAISSTAFLPPSPTSRSARWRPTRPTGNATAIRASRW